MAHDNILLNIISISCERIWFIDWLSWN